MITRKTSYLHDLQAYKLMYECKGELYTCVLCQCYLELALTYTQVCAFGPTNYTELTNLLYNSRISAELRPELCRYHYLTAPLKVSRSSAW